VNPQYGTCFISCFWHLDFWKLCVALVYIVLIPEQPHIWNCGYQNVLPATVYSLECWWLSFVHPAVFNVHSHEQGSFSQSYCLSYCMLHTLQILRGSFLLLLLHSVRCWPMFGVTRIRILTTTT